MTEKVQKIFAYINYFYYLCADLKCKGELQVRHFGIALGAANNPIESIETIPADTPSASKQLRDGHIFILRGDKTYTLTGQPYGDK